MRRCTVIPLFALRRGGAVRPGAGRRGAAAGRCGDVAAAPVVRHPPVARHARRPAPGRADARREDLAARRRRADRRLGREGSHTGTSLGVERVGLPPIYFSDGPVGTRQGKATAMPSPMTLAATFDPARRHATPTRRRRGQEEGQRRRLRARGEHDAHPAERPHLRVLRRGPVPVGADRRRLDPRRPGRRGDRQRQALRGQQPGGHRPPPPPGVPVGAATTARGFTVDAHLDERTLREIYLPQFEAAISEGGVGSVMCSYPRVNGQYACENQHLLEDILKGDWGFDGFVLTDYGAGKNTVDVAQQRARPRHLPGVVYSRRSSTPRWRPGQATEADGRRARAPHPAHAVHVRLLRPRRLRRRRDADRPGGPPRGGGRARGAGHRAAEERRPLLPLDAAQIGKLAVIGPEADAIKDGGGSSAIDEFKTDDAAGRRSRRARRRARRLRRRLRRRAAAAAAKGADVAVVVVGDDMTEGFDKPCMGLNCGQTGRHRPRRADRGRRRRAAEHGRRAAERRAGPHAVARQGARAPRGVVPRPERRHGHRARAVRRRRAGRPPAGDVPGQRGRPADEPATRRYPGVGETRQVQGGRPHRLPLVRRAEARRRLPVRLRPELHDVRLLRPAAEPGQRRDVARQRRRDEHRPRAGTAVPQLYVGMPAPGGGEVAAAVAAQGLRAA